MLGSVGRQNRHKSLTEGPFGKQATEQIRNPKSHIEGIGQSTGPESRGDQQLAHEPRDPGGQGENRHNRGRTEEAHSGRV